MTSSRPTTPHRQIRQVWALLAGLLLSGWSAAAASDQRITAEGQLEIMLPPELRGLPITRPHVDFMIDVGADGTLFDAMPTASNHRDLLPAATAALYKINFTPAIENGVPVRARDRVRMHFYDPEQRAWRQGSGQLPFGGTPSDAAKNRIFATSAQSFVYEMSERDELDSPITKSQSTRRVYSSQNGIKTVGTCLVEFYIGPNGRARFPTAIESDNDDVAISAALTLLETRFNPPRKNGHPTYVKIQQRFRFE